MKNEIKIEKENIDDRPYTFKITKRRSPWTPEEDEGITALVNKYGTGNWTLIANEMSNLYGYKNRSGKQCRERWHNHLDPSINKDYWTEEEENVLFKKHMEYGNKWSDIAKFLPGRTDNAIKNHFYSKLRKFIRKILKQINKDNLLKANGIDPNKYNSDRVYKMIKKNKLAYNSLNKDTILTMILNYEKSSKGGRSEAMMGRKTQRKKGGKGIAPKGNLYSEKINKRFNQSTGMRERTFSENYQSQQSLAEIHSTQTRARLRGRNNINEIMGGNSLYTTNVNTRSRRMRKENNMIQPIVRPKRNLKRRHFNDFIYDDEDFEDENMIEENDYLPVNDENGKEVVKRNLNIIINKSQLFKDFEKEEEERLSNESRSAEKSGKQEFSYPATAAEVSKSDTTTSLLYNQPTSSLSHDIQPIPILNPLLTSIPQSNYLDDRIFRYESFPFMDPNMPLISPINPSKLYPNSARNYFNIDMFNEGSYSLPMSGFNMFRPTMNKLTFANLTNLISSPEFSIPEQPPTPNKEVALRNKILINTENQKRKNETVTPSLRQDEPEKVSEQKKPETDQRDLEKEIITPQEQETEKKRMKLPSIDLNLVNEYETGKLFRNSVTNKSTAIITGKSNLLEEKTEKEPEGLSNEIRDNIPEQTGDAEKGEKEEERCFTNESDKSGELNESRHTEPRTPLNAIDKSATISNNQAQGINRKNPPKANLLISPKSAFVKMLK